MANGENGKEMLSRAPWYLPWIGSALFGVLVILGLLSTLIYGLPWARQTDLDKLVIVVSADHQTLEGTTETLALAAERLRAVTGLVEHIQGKQETDEANTVQNSIHILGLEADEKARMAHEELRKR